MNDTLAALAMIIAEQRMVLAAQAERIEAVEAENAALRANTGKAHDDH